MKYAFVLEGVNIGVLYLHATGEAFGDLEECHMSRDTGLLKKTRLNMQQAFFMMNVFGPPILFTILVNRIGFLHDECFRTSYSIY